jgi:cobalamin-dependent methionine synthase I
MEQWSRQVMQGGDPALGYISDSVAYAVAEAVADRLHDHIGREMARNGWRITNRYSPGYCNWSVVEQHLLFALLPSHFCGITLGESALMRPMKSVSGVVGVGSEVKYADYLCDVCGTPDCACCSTRPRTTVTVHPN